MNTYAKGRRTEKLAREWWETRGYAVWQAKITRHGSNDFFGLFDLVALKKGYPNVWIQVKSNRCPKKVRNEILIFCDKYFLVQQNVACVMVKPDRKPWKFFNFFGEGVQSGKLTETEFCRSTLFEYPALPGGTEAILWNH